MSAGILSVNPTTTPLPQSLTTSLPMGQDWNLLLKGNPYLKFFLWRVAFFKCVPWNTVPPLKVSLGNQSLFIAARGVGAGGGRRRILGGIAWLSEGMERGFVCANSWGGEGSSTIYSDTTKFLQPAPPPFHLFKKAFVFMRLAKAALTSSLVSQSRYARNPLGLGSYLKLSEPSISSTSSWESLE